MSFDTFLASAWNDHGDRPQEVADRLAVSLPMVTSPEQLPRFAGLVTHVYGEHLGQWRQGVALLESLRGLPAFDGGGADGPIQRGIAVLRHAGGENGALDALSREDRVGVLASVAAAFAGRHEFDAALAAYGEAVQLANPSLTAGSPAIRALAIGGNNLAAALEGKKDRSAAQTEGMVAAAENGLRYWKQAGSWLEEERAEYRLARSLVAAGRPGDAVQAALRCIAVCEAHRAPAFEQFFGHAVLALSQRAAGDAEAFEASRRHARLLHGKVPGDERQWCATDLRELEADVP